MTDAITPAPTIDEDGTVHVPAFSAAPSAFLSAEAKRAIVDLEATRRARMASDEPGDDEPGSPEFWARVRARWDEDELEPLARRLREVFPVTITPRVIGGIPTEVIEPVDGPAPENASTVLINIHGGAFVTGAGTAGRVESIPVASIGGFRVVAVDYRLAPESIFPAAVEDVTAVYRELLETYAPERIGVYGTSAGGMTTGELMPWLATQGLPRPGGAGILAAGATATQDGDSYYVGVLLDHRVGVGPRPPRVLDEYFRDRDRRDPVISPAYSLEALASFPRTLLISSMRDPQLSNAVFTHCQLTKAGVDARLHLWDGLGHGFYAQPWSNVVDPDVPEIRDAWNVIVRFFADALA